MMKHPFRFAFFLLMCLALPLTATAQIVDIPDSNLRTAIESALGKAAGDSITKADMEERLILLEARNANISNLTGLEGATNLTRLELRDNNITDISPLTGLTNLMLLDLQGNTISDISALAVLTNLTWLNLWYNTLSDISSLASLTNLRELFLGSNNITDLSPVIGLTNLTQLQLWGNSISDLSPLVANTGLGSGDAVDVQRNPLNRASIEIHIPALQNRGVTVEFDNVITDADFEPIIDEEDTEFDMPDWYLRAAINAALGKGADIPTPITIDEMADLTRLDARNANITDLTGLEFAINLEELNLGAEWVEGEGWVHSNSASDLSPLAGLTNLKRLDLRGNNISNISPLAGLTNLIWLDLWSNRISDLSPVAGLTNLTELRLGGNSVSNLSSLSGLTNLATLLLQSNKISDLSPLVGLTNLTRLGVASNNISDLSPLAGLTNLETLGFHGNRISDLSPLAGLTNLKKVVLRHNSISDLSPLASNTGLGSGDTVNVKGNPLNPTSINTHIPALQSRGVTVEFDNVIIGDIDDIDDIELMDQDNESITIPDPALRDAIRQTLGKTEGNLTPDDMTLLYDLFARNISDLTGLELATNLHWLLVSGSVFEDVSPLSGLTNLRILYIHSSNLSDLSPLTGLTNLETLSVSGSNLSDLSPLTGLMNLETLVLSGSNLSDLSPLTGLTNLKQLGLTGSISDLSLLAGLTNLESLWLNHNNISDLSPLTGLTNLRHLSLHNNSISSLSPLVANTGLGTGDLIELWGNPLNEASIRTHIPALRDRGVDVDLRTPTTLVKISGTVTAENNLLIVEVWDKRARSVEGVPVTFTVTSGGGTLSVTNVATDDRGRAESQLTLGANPGTNTVEATVESISESVIFSDVPEPPVRIPDRKLRAAVEQALRKTRVDTITASDMKTLRQLRAPNANISNLTGLELATNLTELSLRDEYVDGVSINSNSVSDLSPLAGLTKLRDLSLPSNNVSDLSPLAGLTSLRSLYLSGNAISDISALAGLINLEWLNLDDNAISDISALAGLINLEQLNLDHNNITDLSPLAGLTSLGRLRLSGNAISDISALAGLINLEWLNLDDNAISDISALAGLINLESLNLNHNNITDLSPLIENMGLEGDEDYVDVDGNPLSALSIEAYIPALRNRGVRVYFVHALSKERRFGHQAGVSSVAFSPDSTMLASGSQDGTVRLWDVTTGERSEIAILNHPPGTHVRSVAFSPDGSMLASGSSSDDGTIYLWDVSTEQIIHTLKGHKAGVESVVFSPDGSTLASGGHDGTVRLWNPVTGKPIDILLDGPDTAWSVAYSPDGNTIAIGLGNGTILLGDVSDAQLPKFLSGHTAWVESVAFSPDGATLASGSGDNTVRLWEVATGDRIDTLTGHTAGINSVAFSSDDTILASGSDDNTIILWDILTGEPIDTLTGHNAYVRSVAFSPDGSTLASGGGDTTIRLWKTPTTFTEYTLSIPVGISLIHVPLKVTAVNGEEQTIEWIADLYDALGGASKVTNLITYDSETQEWLSYFGAPDKDLPANAKLTQDKGVIASLKAEVSVHLRGSALGTDGVSTVTLRQGANLVGLPLNDSRIKRVSDLLALDGIDGNVPVIILTDNEEFKSVGRVGDSGDIEITGGQAFIMNAQRAATVAISGEGWTNPPGTAAAPSMLTGIQVTDTTPVLALRGAIVDEGTSLKVSNFRVTVKNLSTGKSVTGTIKDDDSVGYRVTVVDIETMRAATVGDILEISAHTPDPFIGVEPLRYTVTAEDVKRSLIQLPALGAYEIPAETELLSNYPNPFNPETWIPYRLAEDAFVTLTIYDSKGHVVRSLDVGHQVAAVYENRSKAIYWDGRNEFGEQVASGLYFYHLSAGDYSATRRMVILK